MCAGFAAYGRPSLSHRDATTTKQTKNNLKNREDQTKHQTKTPKKTTNDKEEG